MGSRVHTGKADDGQCQTVVRQLIRHTKLTPEKIEDRFSRTFTDWTPKEKDRFVEAVTQNHGYKLAP